MRFGDWLAPIIRGCGSLTVETARACDRGFVFTLAEAHKRQMGFFPEDTYHKVIAEGRVLLTRLDGERIGYTMTSGGRYSRPVLRQSAILLEFRDRGYGSCQTIASLLWAAEQTRFDEMEIRTRTDIERQLKINSLVGGQIRDQGRNEFTRGDERIFSYVVHLPTFVRRFAAGDLDR